MRDYKVIIHYKLEPDYETFISANSINSAKVMALILAFAQGFDGDISKQPTVELL